LIHRPRLAIGPAETSTTTGHNPPQLAAAAIALLALIGTCAPALGASSNAPHITHATISPARFAVSGSGPPEVQASVARGTVFRYQLSKKADVFFFLDRGAPGRVVGGHCRRATRTNSHHKHCAFYVRSGSFKQAGKEGTNVKPFSGRVGKRTLTPAHYKVTLVAVDNMGNPSTPGTVLRFTILRG
jgi:hypothetical protein